ncbi:MAG: hypothetical protein KKB05_00220 [Proteobacteria bacterium]|nr:hypothetical protein [Pseudomonadota bacterium]
MVSMIRKKLFTIISTIALVISFWMPLSMAGDIYITKFGYVAAKTEDLIELVVYTLLENDRAGFNSLLDSSPDIFPLEGGTQVYIEDTAIYTGRSSQKLVKIRQIGKNYSGENYNSMWTLGKAIYRQDKK